MTSPGMGGGALRNLGLLPACTALWSWDPSANPPPPPALIGREAAAMASATRSRAAEFARGRWCARQALGAFGIAPTEIPLGPHREPIWPPGVVGSITHCPGLVAAAVARVSDLSGLGLDAEPRDRLDPDLEPAVLTTAERRHTSPGNAGEPPEAGLVAFSAKEALFKAVFPLLGFHFDFLDVEIRTDWTLGSFSAHGTESVPARLACLLPHCAGRFTLTGTHVITAVTLPRE